jgi:uncharacterized protein YecE (DUF72 family)
MLQWTSSRFWAGTSGLVLPVPNKAAFPENFRDQPRLAYYASLFNSLEINSSFYKVPMRSTFEKWAATVPEGFQFTVKLGRHITHERGFIFNPKDIDSFLTAANGLGHKKGCLLIQFPPSLHQNDHNTQQLEILLQSCLQSDPSHSWKLAVEFRHSSWYIPAIHRLLDTHWASIVLHDMPASGVATPNENGFIYIRLHGPAGDYKGGYPNDQLGVYAKRVKGWLAEGKDVYMYFNNTIGDAVANCRAMMKLITPSPLQTSSSAPAY